MTNQTPIERAAEAVDALDLPDEFTRADAFHVSRLAYESIDVEGIAQAIHDGPEAQRQYAKGGIAPHSWADCTFREQYLNDARAVKAHLTGGTP